MAHPFLSKLNALLGQQSRGQDVTDLTDPTAGAGPDGGASGSQGNSSTTPTSDTPVNFAPFGPPGPGQQRMGAPHPEDAQPNPDANPTAPAVPDVIKASIGAPPSVQSEPREPLLADQGGKNKILKFLSRVTGMSKPSPAPGQMYTGPITPEDKTHALASWLSRVSDKYQQNFGSPFDRDLAMKRLQLGNEAAWRAAMVGAKFQANDINQQKADTAQSKMVGDMRRYGYALNDPSDPSSGFRSLTEQEILSDPELGSKFRLQMSKMGLNDAQTDKIRDMLMGRYEVDPWIAAVSGDPTIAGQKISAQQFQNINKVMQAKGIQIKDLGTEGLWAVDRIGNKIHQVSAVAPSVARAQMYAMLRPVQAITPEGDLSWMTAGNAIAQGAAPAASGVQAMAKGAQVTDIYSGIASMKSAIAALPEDELSLDQITKLQAILREPDDSLRETLWTNFMGSQRLSPEEQNFVVALQQLRERALSVRNLASMGVGSDQQRAAVLNSLPGLLSGNKQMMEKQLNAFTNFLDNLATGVPKIAGHRAGGGGAKQKPTGWQ